MPPPCVQAQHAQAGGELCSFAAVAFYTLPPCPLLSFLTEWLSKLLCWLLVRCMPPSDASSPACCAVQVSSCPECDEGMLVLDPVSAPKWRLDCNHCNFLIYLPKDLHSAKVSSKQTCEVVREPEKPPSFEWHHSNTAGGPLTAVQLCDVRPNLMEKLVTLTCLACFASQLNSLWSPEVAALSRRAPTVPPVQSSVSCPACTYSECTPRQGTQRLMTGGHPTWPWLLCAGMQLKPAGAGLQERGVPTARRGDAPRWLRRVQQPPATAL